MNSSDKLTQLASPTEGKPQAGILSPDPDPSLQEFYQLQQGLFKATLLLTGIIFVSVWIFYSVHMALNYLIGACTGVEYLKLLARNVEKLGREKTSIGKEQLAVFIGAIVLASQWHQLEILPIFLGFLTYKVAIITYMLQTLFSPNQS